MRVAQGECALCLRRTWLGVVAKAVIVFMPSAKIENLVTAEPRILLRLGEADSLTEAERQGTMTDGNLLLHYEDFELAQKVKRDLMRLRSRSSPPASEDIMLIAGKAALVGPSHGPSRVPAEKVREEAWLAICR